MTTVTIQIPDREAQEVLSYIQQKGGKIVEKLSSVVKPVGDSLAYSHLDDHEVNAMTIAYAESSLTEGWELSDEDEYN